MVLLAAEADGRLAAARVATLALRIKSRRVKSVFMIGNKKLRFFRMINCLRWLSREADRITWHGSMTRAHLQSKFHQRAVWGTASLLETTCRHALNFLLALSSNRRDCQNRQIKFGPISSSFDVSKSKNGRRSSAAPCLQPRSPGPQALGTAEAVHAGCKFSACNFGYGADASVRPTSGAFAPA